MISELADMGLITKSKLINFLNMIRLAFWLNRLITFLSIVVFIVYLINISSILYQTTAPKSITYTKDNDAGRAIQTSTITKWYNSNHFAPYGNLYFRISNTLANLSPHDFNDEWSNTENNEIRHHFALMITSLIALSVLCLVIGFLLTKNILSSVIIGNVLLHLAMFDKTWVEFIFRAHPDHLLMLSILGASYYTLRYSRSGDKNDFIYAALLWGVSTAIKRATVLYIPSFLFLFLSDGFKKKNFLIGLKFIGYMLIAYLIIGFPQNFGIYKHLKFMIHESHNSRAPTYNSVIEYLTLIYDQSKYLILAFIPIHLFFGKTEKIINFKFIVFVLLSLLVTVSNRMVTPHQHHTMPFVASFLILSLYIIKCLTVLEFRFKQLTLVVTSFIFFLSFDKFTPNFKKQFRYQMDCRPEAIGLLKKVKTIQSDNSSFLVRDPYFPFDSSKPSLMTQYWGTSMQDIDQREARIFGTTKAFGLQFLDKGPAYNMGDKADNWADKRALYEIIFTKDEFSTPKGFDFKKIYEDECGFILWQR